MAANLKYKFRIFSLKKFSWFLQYNLKLQVSVIITFGDIITVSITLIMKCFIYH